jgi:hypothetical protein
VRTYAIVALAIAGCGAPEDVTPEQDAVEPGIVYETSAPPGPQVVFVNFNGLKVENCGNYCSDAPTNRSWVIGHMTGKASMDFAPFDNLAERATILADLRTLYAAYDVTFVTTRPTSGPYTMVIISPSYMPHHGVAPLDCGNANRNDIAFVYRTGDTGFYTNGHKIAQAAAHELGHSFGLAHVVNTDEIMEWASSGRHFGASEYDRTHPSGKCFSGSEQHAAAMLKASLGAK